MTQSSTTEQPVAPPTLPSSEKAAAYSSDATPATAPPLEFEEAEEVHLQATMPVNSEAVTGIRGMIVAVRERTSRILETQKPWTELLDRNSFSKPDTLGEATSRIQKNLSHYRTNYFLFGVGVTLLAFVTNPSALIWVAVLSLLWAYLFLVRTSPLVINGREISDREKLLGTVGVSFVVIFFLTNVAAIFLYGASLGLLLVGAHASFREPDQLFMDEGHGTSENLFGNVNFLAGAQAYAQNSQAATNMV